MPQQTTALFEGALCGSSEVSHIEIEIGPDCSRTEWTVIGSPEENHSTPGTPEHTALQRQPSLTE